MTNEEKAGTQLTRSVSPCVTARKRSGRELFLSLSEVFSSCLTSVFLSVGAVVVLVTFPRQNGY